MERIRALAPDVHLLVLLSQPALRRDLRPGCKGAFNLHGSLLPAYRGRAPLNWVLVNGETETGVTLHRMVRRADAGAIVAQQKVAIDADDTALQLHQKLNATAQTLLRDALPGILNGTFSETAQGREQGKLLWPPRAGRWSSGLEQTGPPAAQPGARRDRPVAGRLQLCGRQQVHRLEIRVRDDIPAAKPGTVVSVSPLIVSCGEQALEIVTGQTDNGLYVQGTQLAQSLGLVAGALITRRRWWPSNAVPAC
ncbi:formyltransferase family protein [Enterobacter roggenkampii]|uniref:formyltransferase family protein n=1 Tax=Enterobacter roggenkampii TaxID=1812935 RepID=UPI003D6FBCC6